MKIIPLQSVNFSFPQGSMAGPDLFYYYSNYLREIVPKTPDLNTFADNHMLKEGFKP